MILTSLFLAVQLGTWDPACHVRSWPECDPCAQAPFTSTPVLTWDPSPTASGYRVYWKRASSSTWILAADLPCDPLTPESPETCPGVQVGYPPQRAVIENAGRWLDFQVTAYNGQGESPPSNSVRVCWPLVATAP